MLFFILFSCSNDTTVHDKIGAVTGEESQEQQESEAQEEDEAQEEEEIPLCEDIEVAAESAYISQGESVTDERAFCNINWHAGAGAKGSTIAVTLDDWEGDDGASIRVTNLLDETILESELAIGDSVTFEQDRSGEFFVQVSPLDINEESNSYQLSVDCIAQCELEYTRYPIVFLHGLAGFDSLLNIIDYWIGMESLLTDRGFHVEVHAVSAFDTTIVRTEGWMEIIDGLHSDGVGRKFNFIGHSQGGLDARYIASVLDDVGIVESITTISAPHHGTPVADALHNVIDVSPFDGQLIDSILSFGTQVFGSTGEEFSAQMEQMTTENMLAFNDQVPDVSGVSYYSWAGQSCRLIQFICQTQLQGETVSSYFLLSHILVETLEGDNDGLVSVQSAQWGEYLGLLPADHMDEIGHRYDFSSQPFDSAGFYLSEAQRLSLAGH